MPPEIINMVSSFFKFLRTRHEVIHLMFVLKYRGVVTPEPADEDGPPVATLDLSPTQKDESIQVSEWGLKFHVTKPTDMWSEFPWDSLLIISNDYGLAWANKPMLLAMGMVAGAEPEDEQRPKYLQ